MIDGGEGIGMNEYDSAGSRYVTKIIKRSQGEEDNVSRGERGEFLCSWRPTGRNGTNSGDSGCTVSSERRLRLGVEGL